MGASAVSDQDEFYMYLWLFLSRNSEKQHCSQPKSRSIASYWQQKRCWSETADAPLLDFYEFLVDKYKKHLVKDTNKIDKELEELSWEMGQKLYSSREEFYER